MMKNVQISQELFVALLHYHLSGEKEYEEIIEQGLEQKLGTRKLWTGLAQSAAFCSDCLQWSCQ
jgi:adenosine deaminase